MMIESMPHQDESEGDKNSDDLSLNGESWLTNWNEDVRLEEFVQTTVELSPDLEISPLPLMEDFSTFEYKVTRIRQIGPGRG